jgi:hypothetical protein
VKGKQKADNKYREIIVVGKHSMCQKYEKITKN